MFCSNQTLQRRARIAWFNHMTLGFLRRDTTKTGYKGFFNQALEDKLRSELLEKFPPNMAWKGFPTS